MTGWVGPAPLAGAATAGPSDIPTVVLLPGPGPNAGRQTARAS